MRRNINGLVVFSYKTARGRNRACDEFNKFVRRMKFETVREFKLTLTEDEVKVLYNLLSNYQDSLGMDIDTERLIQDIKMATMHIFS